MRRLSRRSFLAGIPPFGFEQGIHHAAVIHQSLAELAAAVPGAQDVAEGDDRTGQVLAHRPAVVVEDDRQTVPALDAVGILDQDVGFSVISLSDGIGSGRLVAMDQVEGFAVGF